MCISRNDTDVTICEEMVEKYESRKGVLNFCFKYFEF